MKYDLLGNIIPKRNYGIEMYNALNKYGIGSAFAMANSKCRISLEALDDELTANEEEIENRENEEYNVDGEWSEPYDEGFQTSEDSWSDNGENTDTDTSEAIDEAQAEMNDYTNLSNDGEFGVSNSGDYVDNEVGNVDTTDWQNVSEDDLKSDAQCINVVKIITNFTNDYVKNMEEIQKSAPNIIEYTGDFKSNPLYEPFVSQANKIVNVVLKDSEIVKYANDLLKLLEDKRKMSSIAGTKESPFLYEGIQLVAFELYRTLLGVIPFYLKHATSVEDIVKKVNLNVLDVLVQMAADLVEINNMFGTKIFYVAPVVSEVTGRSEEIAGTPYVNLESCQPVPFSKMVFARESIMNLIEIKNNNALVEFSILSKMMRVVSGLVKDVKDYEKSCLDTLASIKFILNEVQSENADQVIDEACEKVRENVFIPQIEAMSNMAKEEAIKATDSSNEQELTPLNVGATVDVPKEDGSIEEVNTLEGYNPYSGVDIITPYFGK